MPGQPHQIPPVLLVPKQLILMIRPYGAHGVPWRPPHLPCCPILAPYHLDIVRPSPHRQAHDDVLSCPLSRPSPRSPPRSYSSYNSNRRGSGSRLISAAISSSSTNSALLHHLLPRHGTIISRGQSQRGSQGGQCCHGVSLAFPHIALIASSSLQSLQGQHHRARYQHHQLRHHYQRHQIRGKKTVTTIRLSDLPQGLIQRDPLPLPPLDRHSNTINTIDNTIGQDEPVYPTVVLQARQNMRRFDNCVLLTRVGGFYELYFEHADEYGPLLNLKVASKKTNAGPVPMVSASTPPYSCSHLIHIPCLSPSLSLQYPYSIPIPIRLPPPSPSTPNGKIETSKGSIRFLSSLCHPPMIPEIVSFNIHFLFCFCFVFVSICLDLS